MSTTATTLNTPSRHLSYDSQAPSSASPSQTPTPPPSHPTSPHTTHAGQGPTQDVSTRRPTKRQRRTRSGDNMTAERASSSSDSSSQSGMADNDTEAERTHLPSDEHTAPQANVPPKKKRTRTLTTPHQSAVLHALLAKSRFPTTAMREEVGRQIGLSARKVQIWFQNQRQKARRPQGESAPLTRPPPQFGPFPIMTSAGPSAPTYPSPSTGGPASEKSLSGSRSAAHESSGSLDPIPALSGPGMPGQSSSSHPPHGPLSAEEWEPPRSVSTSPAIARSHFQQPLPPRSSEGISKRDFLRSTHGSLPPRQTTPIETSPQFSRVLPPLNLSALRSRSSTEPYVSATTPFAPLPPTPRTSVTVVQRHDALSAEPASPGALHIPPPFALQPQPQWDPVTFTPYTRPEFTSWSSTGSSRSSARTSFPAVGAHDRVMAYVSPDGTRGRHVHASSRGGDPRRGTQPDHPPLHSPSPGHRLPHLDAHTRDQPTKHAFC